LIDVIVWVKIHRKEIVFENNLEVKLLHLNALQAH